MGWHCCMLFLFFSLLPSVAILPSFRIGRWGRVLPEFSAIVVSTAPSPFLQEVLGWRAASESWQIYNSYLQSGFYPISFTEGWHTLLIKWCWIPKEKNKLNWYRMYIIFSFSVMSRSLYTCTEKNWLDIFSSPSFWDWEKGEKLDYFHNGNPRYTRITAMEYLNGQDCSLLLTATGK